MSAKISEDMATSEFDRLVDALYLDLHDLDDKESKDFEGHKRTIVKAISNGSLVINDEGFPIYTPVRSDDKEPITFYEMTGSNLIDMDKGKENENIKKLFSVMQSITKKPTGCFAKMKKNPDLKVCIAIATLFLAG